MTQETIRIFVVDDHFVVRRGLVSFLNVSNDLQVVGETDNGEDAITHCEDLMPDIVLMDVVLPNIDGIDTCAVIKKKFPNMNVIMPSSFSDTTMVRRAIDAVATGYLLKDAHPQQILDAIRMVQSGSVIIANELTSALTHPTQKTIDFKSRELSILRLISKGYTNKQIAQELNINYATVKHCVREILAKTETASRAEAVAFALENDII